jgi:branched-chain amino acid transport system ATP-binding protein
VSSPVLELRDVSAAYGHIDVLHGIDLAVAAGEVLALLGPNGAGKTTTVRVVAGLLRPTGGRVLMAGHDVTGTPPDRLARAGVCVVPEGRGVFPRLTVEEHLRLVAPSRREVARTLEVAFGHFPRLADRRRQPAGTLSGGEQQMLALARAVAQDPPLLVIDELSMGLAPLVVAHLYEHVAALAAGGVSIVVVEQFAHDVLGVAHHAVVMQHGRIIRADAPAAIADDLADLYLATPATSATPATPATLGGAP